MQRINSIQIATINAFAGFQFGLATVVANAAAGTTSMRTHVSKCSDPGKSEGSSYRRWHRDWSTGRRGHESHAAAVPVVSPVVSVTPSTTGPLPPTLWVASVLCRSLCG